MIFLMIFQYLLLFTTIILLLPRFILKIMLMFNQFTVLYEQNPFIAYSVCLLNKTNRIIYKSIITPIPCINNFLLNRKSFYQTKNVNNYPSLAITCFVHSDNIINMHMLSYNIPLLYHIHLSYPCPLKNSYPQVECHVLSTAKFTNISRNVINMTNNKWYNKPQIYKYTYLFCINIVLICNVLSQLYHFSFISSYRLSTVINIKFYYPVLYDYIKLIRHNKFTYYNIPTKTDSWTAHYIKLINSSTIIHKLNELNFHSLYISKGHMMYIQPNTFYNYRKKCYESVPLNIHIILAKLPDLRNTYNLRNTNTSSQILNYITKYSTIQQKYTCHSIIGFIYLCYWLPHKTSSTYHTKYE